MEALMAKVTYDTALSGDFLGEFYSGEFSFSVAGNGNKATFIDDEQDGGKIKGFGKNLEGDENGLTGGKFEKLVFINDDGETLVTVKGQFNARTLSQATEEGNFQDLQLKILGGNDNMKGSSAADALFGYDGDDKINGHGAADVINGGTGKDVLTGGGGWDTFFFNAGDGRDVIKDFQLGTEDHHEEIRLSSNYELTENDNGDAMIVLTSGDRLILQGISMDQLEDYHILTPV
jgi:Ca2+-binding RTX toxin-like protein